LGSGGREPDGAGERLLINSGKKKPEIQKKSFSHTKGGLKKAMTEEKAKEMLRGKKRDRGVSSEGKPNSKRWVN